MENKLEIFKNDDLGEIGILKENNKELFEATGVAKVLGYSNPYDAIQRHCKEDGVVKHEVMDSMGRMQNKNFITEGNLYRLITHSKLPSAEKFEKWVFDDVLPSIRKHGVYAVDELLNNPDFAIKALTELKNERAEKEKLQLAIEEQKPKVVFADSVVASKTSILVGDLAKLIKQNGYDIGQNRLFQWLRDNGFLCNKKGDMFNMPTQKSMNLKLFEVKERTIDEPNGSVRITKTPKVTGKGQVYFINKFKELVC